MSSFSLVRQTSVAMLVMMAGGLEAARADLTPTWVTRIPLPYTPGNSMADMVTDADGNTYVVGGAGNQNNWDILVSKIATDGTVLWTTSYDSDGGGDEQGRTITLAPDGSVLIGGNTPGPFQYADALVLRLDGATGDLIWATSFDWTEIFSSDSAMEIVAAPDGSVYFGGHCNNGDGLDCLTVKLDAAGEVVWAKNWDGPAWAPYSQEAVRGLLLAPDGNVVMMNEGVQASNHPDYVLVKYDAADGSILWQKNWGVNGYDEPREMVIDAAGDIYVTGIGINLTNQISTVKFRGSDGEILWQVYDTWGFHNGAAGVALDPSQAGVYVAARFDPDGNKSNFNDNFFIIKHDAATGEPLWTFFYGADCKNCYDVPSDIRVDAFGNVLVVGTTSSPPYSSDQILFVLDPTTGLEIDRGVVSGTETESVSAQQIHFDQAQNIYTGGTFGDFNTGGGQIGVVKYISLDNACLADCDASGSLSIDDFICFQTRFAIGDPQADCDSDMTLTIDDFICFQTLFAIGC